MGARRPGGLQDTATKLQLAYVEKVLWAIVRRTPIRPADIATRFGVSRSSAYRWAYSLEQARLLAQTMEIPRGAGHRTPVQADTEARAQ